MTDSINRRTQLLTGLAGLSLMGVVLCLFFATEAGLFGIAACLYIYVWRPFSASFLLCSIVS